MANLRKSQVIFAIIASVALLQVSAVTEDSNEESSEYNSGSLESWEDSEISLHGDTKVNYGGSLPSEEEAEPLFYHSDEVDYSEELDDIDARPDDSRRNSEMDSDSSEEVGVTQEENKTEPKNSSLGAPDKTNLEIGSTKPNVSVPDIDVAPSLILIPEDKLETMVSEEDLTDEGLGMDSKKSGTSVPDVAVAPALDLIPAESTKPEEVPSYQDAPALVPGQQNSKDEEVPETPELEVIPHGINPDLVNIDEENVDQEMYDDLNKLESELKRLTNPRYASVARNHRVLLTSIIIGFFALAIATVLFTFYRGFIVFTRVIRSRTGGNYRRMQEEVDTDSIHGHVFQQKV